jgi:hypothetical protein
MYISWLILLLGAELCASMPKPCNRRQSSHIQRPEKSSFEQCSVLAVLHALSMASRTGEKLTTSMLAKLTASQITNIHALLPELNFISFFGQMAKGNWLLAQDLDTVSLHDLSVRLDIQPDMVELNRHELVWRRRFAGITEDTSNATAQSMSTSLMSGRILGD